MRARINDTRVYTNNMAALYSVEAPPLGSYDPVDPLSSGFEDKAKLNLIRAKQWSPREAHGTLAPALAKSLPPKSSDVLNPSESPIDQSKRSRNTLAPFVT